MKAVDQHLADLSGQQLRLVRPEFARGGPGALDGRADLARVERGTFAAALEDLAGQGGGGGGRSHNGPLNTTFSAHDSH